MLTQTFSMIDVKQIFKISIIFVLEESESAAYILKKKLAPHLFILCIFVAFVE